MPGSEQLPTRRSLRESARVDAPAGGSAPGSASHRAHGSAPHSASHEEPPERPRHGRFSLTQRGRRVAAAVAAAIVILALTAAVTAGVSSALSAAGPGAGADAQAVPRPAAPGVTALPVPAQRAAAVPTCGDPAVAAAVAGGTDAEVIAAFGGAVAFRTAVAAGAGCISLSDPNRVWVVVDKQRPLDPIDWEPEVVVAPQDMQRTADVRLRPEAAAALTALVAAAAGEGAGAIGLNSAFRSYRSQTETYEGYVGSLGRDAADLQSARPGYSEHQTGLATDVMACSGGCSAIEAFGGTTQGDWVAGNAWRFGFIVRYEAGYTEVTGYAAEPWHLRYIGVELAQAYHEGGFHTLEEFFSLPAAPTY